MAARLGWVTHGVAHPRVVTFLCAGRVGECAQCLAEALVNCEATDRRRPRIEKCGPGQAVLPVTAPCVVIRSGEIPHRLQR